jgi:hypothetical protein
MGAGIRIILCVGIIVDFLTDVSSHYRLVHINIRTVVTVMTVWCPTQ